MHYLFRDVAYRGKTIRFVKPSDIDSDGPRITANIAKMLALSQHIECNEPQTTVIALLGRGIIGCSREAESRKAILKAFQKKYRRLPDTHYEWNTAEWDSPVEMDSELR